MASRPGRFGNRLHLALAALSLWLIATSPWIGMLRRIPPGAGWLDWSHVASGFLTMLLTVVYAWIVTRAGRWQLIIPLCRPQLRAVRRDVLDLLRGRIPASESGGLFGLIEGLLLAALLLCGASGAGWYFAQGTDAVLGWRAVHEAVAIGLIGLLAAHSVAVGLHLVEFVRD